MAVKVLILAGDTDGNLGDLAIVTATCAAIRNIDPAAEISIPTSSPGRDVSRLNIRPIRRGVSGVIDLAIAARRADLIMCGGGGLFQDDDSLAKMPYWALRLMFVRLFAKSIHGLSIGAGPLTHRVSRFFASVALRQMASISVRDKLAKSMLQPLTDKRISIVPDPAFCLRAAPQADADAVLATANIQIDNRPWIGVSVRRWFHKRSAIIPYKYAARLGMHKHRGQDQMQIFIHLLAKSLRQVVDRTGAHVLFLPTYNVDHEADQDVCRQVAANLEPGTHATLHLDDPRLYKTICGMLSAVVCGRMHPGILAAGQGTPILGLAYNQKFFGTFNLLGFERTCISIESFVDEGRSSWLADNLIGMMTGPSRNPADSTNPEERTHNAILKLVTQAMQSS